MTTLTAVDKMNARRLKKTSHCQWLLRSFFALAVCMACQPATAQVFDLRCCGLAAPLGIDTACPYFDWKNGLQHNGQGQSAYEIEVATDSIMLISGHADLWKSGKVHSSQQVGVAYAGVHLAPRQLCYWRVRTWDETGAPSAWSATARFAVGPLDGIGGEYIGCMVDGSPVQTPLLSTSLTSDSQGPVFAYINSVGYHVLYVNGKRVEDRVMQPAVSQLDRRSLIVTYDLTSYVHPGKNEIMLSLGQGWGRVYHQPAAVKAEIVQKVNGVWHTLAHTDSSWVASPSEFSYTGSWQPLQFGGERCDYSQHPKWQRASVLPIVNMTATPQTFEGNRIIDTLKPAAVHALSDGTTCIDFGHILTGWFQAVFLSPEQGTEISMEYLDHADAKPPHTETDTYIALGSGEEYFSNRFHTHSFRYVRINGAAVDTNNVQAMQISAISPSEGATFECSDPRLNAIHDMVKHTLSCLTFNGYMVDCPHIERMGYGGDGNSSTMTLQTLWDVRSTYANWMQAWVDAMQPDGELPYVAPAFRTGGGPYWCGFIIKAPWRTCLNYGDRSLIHRYYGDMKRWLEYIERHSNDYILQPWPDNERHSWFLGDWAVPEGVDKGGESVLHASSCFISDCLADMVRMASMTGYPDDAQHYAAWRQNLNASIHRHFYHPESHTYANGTPLDQCYALLMGIPPDCITAAAVETKLINDCHYKYHDHIAAGLMGVPIFTEWCIRERQADLMATILRQPDYPGYLYMIENGATTTWESWNCGRPGKEDRSRVHNCYNGIGIWFYQALAGIRPDPEEPGYKHFFIDPQPCEGVEWVKATKPTPYGTIRVDIEKGQLKVEIPQGSTATVFPGTPKERQLTSGKHIIKL